VSKGNLGEDLRRRRRASPGLRTPTFLRNEQTVNRKLIESSDNCFADNKQHDRLVKRKSQLNVEVPGSKEARVGVSKENLDEDLRLQRRASPCMPSGPCGCPRYGETEKS
jgi:hypothetical protein